MPATTELNISELAIAFDRHRQTVRRRLREGGVEPTTVRAGVALYPLGPAARAIVIPDARQHIAAPDGLSPADRRTWFQSERARISVELTSRRLRRADVVARELAALMKALAHAFEFLPDQVEQDGGAPEDADAIERWADRARERLYAGLVSDADS